MAPVRRGGPRRRPSLISSPGAARSTSRGGEGGPRGATEKRPDRARTAVPPGRGYLERTRGIPRSNPRPNVGKGKRPGEEVYRDPGKPEPDEPAEETTE